ncbi:transcriptional adapter 1-like [Mercenaria mercenaria]|uniref:transcriptional adapter 1-like n=1 Tax=Mercenaria mercenaria TaxID=6596 RepID=UPI001E1E094E|nr:transcriptional adapter 1-like [Mercenaria mercenaria]
MAAPIDLNAAKNNLADALGSDMKSYLHHLKSWFRQKIAKEEFDMEARKLLSSETVHLHNEFLLAIFSKCQTFTSSLGPKSPPGRSHSGHGKLLKKGKLKRRPTTIRSSFQQRFVPVNPMSCAVQATYKGTEESIFAGRELTLPDISMIHGRLLVCAWEIGLVSVDDAVVKFIMQALEIHLKNIITQVLIRRNGYKVREGRFRYALGTNVPNPYIRHSLMLQDRTLESEATMITDGQHVPNKRLPQDCNEGYLAQQLSANTLEPTEREPVTLYNLLETLQTYKNTIPSHSVYAPAIERIIHKLWHPSHEELGYTDKQEVPVSQSTASSQPVR